MKYCSTFYLGNKTTKEHSSKRMMQDNSEDKVADEHVSG